MAGCDEGRQSPGKVTVQVVNVAPGFGALSFQRERRGGSSQLQFKGADAFVYDADTYDFFVTEPTTNDADPGRTWTFAPTLEADAHYVFVLSEAAGEVQPIVIAYPPPPAADAQILAVHAASGLPAMDLYLERPGVGIAGATPRASFGALEQMAPRTLPSGEYEMFLTAAGNPADVFVTSPQFSLPAGTTSTIVVVDERGQGTAAASAILMQPSPIALFDVNAEPEMRAINGATDRAPRDVAVNAQFSPPLLSATQFGEPTPYVPTSPGPLTINITPAGNPGVLEAEVPVFAVIGQRTTLLFSGPAGALVAFYATDDGRRLNREAKMRLMNAASQFLAIDYVITPPDSDPNTFPATATLFAPSVSSYVPLYPGDYDLYLYAAGTATLLSGPTRISVAAGGIYSALSIDGPDTSTASLLLLDDFP